MNILKCVCITIFLFFLTNNWTQESISYIRVGQDFSIKFTEHSLKSSDDTLFFIKENDSTYYLNQSIDYVELSQIIKFKIKRKYDSINVYEGYENRYGFLYSETEGAYIYNNKEPETYNFSGWRMADIIDPNRKYSLKFFGYKRGFVNNAPPKVDKKMVQEWCKKQEWCPYDKTISVFCTIMFIRVSIYSNYEIKNYYLKFNRRIGEC